MLTYSVSGAVNRLSSWDKSAVKAHLGGSIADDYIHTIAFRLLEWLKSEQWISSEKAKEELVKLLS